MKKGWMYILKCADNSYYTGSTNNLELRIAQHNAGEGANHTKKRLPVKLVYYEEFQRVDEAFYREKQVQGWSRKKKEALINGEYGKLPDLSLAYRDVASRASATGNEPLPEALEGNTSSNTSATESNTSAISNDSRASATGNDPLPEVLEGNTQGWEIKKLGEICEIKNGGTPKTGISEYWDGELNWITPKDLGKLKNRYMYETPRKITELGLQKSSAKLLPTNSIILSTRAPIGHLAINKSEMATNQGCRGIIPLSKMNTEYIYYFLMKSVDLLNDLGTGATFKELSTRALSNIPITIPPLPEQKRIVSILDRAFAMVEALETKAKQNLKNAKELFESYLNRIFEEKGEDWEEKTLKEITSKIGSGATPRGGKASYKEEGISLVRSMNVHDFEFREKNLAFIDEKQAEALSNVELQENDVLLNITGASIARCCIIPEQYLPARVNQHVSIIRAKQDIVSPIFLASLLTSKFYKDQILETGEQGATRQAITKAQLESFRIALPKIVKEQKQIVEKLDTLSVETKKLQAIYQQKLDNLEELKKSILQKVFNGEL